MNWTHTLKLLVIYHLQQFSFYQSFSNKNNDDEIIKFVTNNISGMSTLYRFGIIGVTLSLDFFAIFFYLLPMSKLKSEQRSKYLKWAITYFPFSLLNRLVCGSIFMRLFELSPTPKTTVT